MRVARELPHPAAPIAARLADYVHDATAASVPPKAIPRLQAYLLDTLSVTVAAIDEPSSSAMLRAVATRSEGEATIVGAGRRAAAETAALANGTFAHTLELDDDHRTGTVHPGAVVIPAALAACEAAGATGERLLWSVLLGYEVMCRAGEAFLGRQFYRGFHPTGTCGVFGAAVAAGVAFRLSRSELVSALGIAGTQSAGLGEWRHDGSWTKRLNAGRAAGSGVLAARLAREGFAGPATVFEGRDGFLRAFAHGEYLDGDALTRGLGTEYRALRTAFKPYPGCRFAHVAIDLALELRALDGIEPDDVAGIEVRLFRTEILNAEPRPASPVIAQFSVPYLVAAALTTGRLTLQDLTPSAIQRPEVQGLADRIQVVEDEGYTRQFPERYPTLLIVTTRDGRSVQRFDDCPLGDPESEVYAGDDARFERDVADKARSILVLSGHAGTFEPLEGAIARLPGAESVAELAATLADVELAPRSAGPDGR